MDKAARALRRSGVKLISIGGGQSELNVLLSEVKDMRQTAKAFMQAQNDASQDLLKWAVKEENRALQDVANQLAELNFLWTDVQLEFVEHLKRYRHTIEIILEGEGHVSHSKSHLDACEQKEMKVRKELKKVLKRSSSSDFEDLECRLSKAEGAKQLAQMEVTDRIRENEVMKMIRLKEGLLKLSQAYSDFGSKCKIIFDAQKDVVEQLPDVIDQDIEDMKYSGFNVTRQKVQEAKEEVHVLHQHQAKKSPRWNSMEKISRSQGSTGNKAADESGQVKNSDNDESPPHYYSLKDCDIIHPSHNAFAEKIPPPCCHTYSPVKEQPPPQQYSTNLPPQPFSYYANIPQDSQPQFVHAPIPSIYPQLSVVFSNHTVSPPSLSSHACHQEALYTGVSDMRMSSGGRLDLATEEFNHSSVLDLSQNRNDTYEKVLSRSMEEAKV